MQHLFHSIQTNAEMRTAALTVGALALVVGFSAGWATGAHRRADTAAVPDGELTMATTTATGTMERGMKVYEGLAEAVKVTNQKAGKKVFVAAAGLSAPAWVAVREEINGEPGKILGAQWFDEGDHEGAVDLLRGTRSGGRYHVYLFKDDGDMKFEPREDVPITKNGLLILQPFTAQ